MRKIFFFMMMIAGTIVSVDAQTPATIRITGTRFTFPIFRKWISKYTQLHPEVKIIIAPGLPADSADLLIISHILKPEDVKEGQTSVVLTRYVQLPVVNSERNDLNLLLTKGFTNASFREIYFTGETNRSNDFAGVFTVYKRQKAACSSVSFANYFGNEHRDIKGIAVAGDDQDLLESVKKDKNAISHNSLGIIYNLRTRRVNDSVSIIPIDLNEDRKINPDEKIYATVDEVLGFVERTNHPKIPTEDVHVIFSKTINQQAVTDFLKWIITEGQTYNHEYGLLHLSKATIREQEKLLVKSNAIYYGTSQLTVLKR